MKVYAVKTTGVFCRYGCPSRRPRPKNVVRFASERDAEREGFRACLRCLRVRPDPVRLAAERLDRGPASLRELGRVAGVSPSHLQRIFKRALGVSPADYVRVQRLRRFRHSVRAGESMLGAMVDAGLGSTSRLYGPGPSLAMPPGRFHRGGAGEILRFTSAPSPLGVVHIAATARGICAVSLGRSTLRRDFPKATFVRDEAGLKRALSAVLKHLRSGSERLGLPLDVRATAFEARVWKELRNVRAGSTISYRELAKRIGRPRAVRAVASACAKNRIAVVIPCHRVVHADGSISGYRWGTARKRRLLGIEGPPTRRAP